MPIVIFYVWHFLKSKLQYNRSESNILAKFAQAGQGISICFVSSPARKVECKVTGNKVATQVLKCATQVYIT